jgi:hypothetical protein
MYMNMIGSSSKNKVHATKRWTWFHNESHILCPCTCMHHTKSFYTICPYAVNAHIRVNHVMTSLEYEPEPESGCSGMSYFVQLDYGRSHHRNLSYYFVWMMLIKCVVGSSITASLNIMALCGKGQWSWDTESFALINKWNWNTASIHQIGVEATQPAPSASITTSRRRRAAISTASASAAGGNIAAHPARICGAEVMLCMNSKMV